MANTPLGLLSGRVGLPKPGDPRRGWSKKNGTPVPLTLYVLWHPSFTFGATLAAALYDWLGAPRGDLRRSGLGIHVYFRSEDWNVDPGHPPPRRQMCLLPVQLTRAVDQVGPEFGATQPVRLDRWKEDWKADEGLRIQRFLRQITQSLVAMLRVERGGAWMAPRKVFLSHAKIDKENGPGVAERLRDIGRGSGKMDTFYDENDLLGATDWEAHLERAAREGDGFATDSVERT